jgi:hypothetical protein
MAHAFTLYEKSICDRFSLYFSLNDCKYSPENRLVAVCDPTLKKLITCLVESEPDNSEEEWARLFLKNAIAASNLYQFLLSTRACICSFSLLILLLKLCQQLVVSYLQLICFYAAKEVSNQLKRSPNLQLHYPLEDCFAIATERSLKPAKLLKSFNFNAGFPLHAYARKALSRTIKNQIVQEVKSKSIKLSDWGILMSFSPKQLETGLLNYGITQASIPTYRLVWQALKEIDSSVNNKERDCKANPKSHRIYVDGKTILNSEQIKQIVNYYQQQQQRLSLTLESITKLAQIEKILAICIAAARNSHQKKFISLEDSSQLEQMAISYDDSLLQREKKSEVNQLKSIIQQKFSDLEIAGQKCLLLWLGLDINQQDLTSLLELTKQYQVTRQFQRYQRILLKEIIEVYNRLDSKVVVDEAQFDYLKDYLHQYCQIYFSDLLIETIQTKLTKTKKQLLIKGIIMPSEKQHSSVKNELTALFKAAIEASLKIQLQGLKSAPLKLTKFIDKWLDNNQASLYIYGDN